MTVQESILIIHNIRFFEKRNKPCLQIMKLKKKVTEMEARQQQREIEWQNILEELKQASSKDQEYAEHKWHQAFDTKSKEVEKIRLELNSILETALSIQQAQIQKNH